jgi:hypothetical protein
MRSGSGLPHTPWGIRPIGRWSVSGLVVNDVSVFRLCLSSHRERAGAPHPAAAKTRAGGEVSAKGDLAAPVAILMSNDPRSSRLVHSTHATWRYPERDFR